MNISTRIRTRPLNPNNEADLQDALAIFQQAFLDPWSKDRLRILLQSRGGGGFLAGPRAEGHSKTTAVVADRFDVPSAGRGLSCGCLVYQCYRTGRRILSVGVLHDATRLGHATALIRTLQKRVLQSPSPEEIVACIAEDNLPAQRCFQKSAFRHFRTLRNYYRDGQAAHVVRWAPGELVERGEGAAVESLRMD